MTRLEKLEHDIKELGHEDLAALRDWFRKYDAGRWDRQFEDDVCCGKMDRLAEEALAAHKAGRTRPL